MNKVYFVISVLTLLISGFLLYEHYCSTELVYVDINKLMSGYKRTAIEKAEFDKKAKDLSSRVDSLIVDWEKELKTFEKERGQMSSKEVELKSELLSNKQKQINSYRNSIQKQIQQEDQKSTQTVINDINDFVKDYGEEHGYKIIFGASGGGNIMYASEASDLTAEILVELNKNYNN